MSFRRSTAVCMDFACCVSASCFRRVSTWLFQLRNIVRIVVSGDVATSVCVGAVLSRECDSQKSIAIPAAAEMVGVAGACDVSGDHMSVMVRSV